MLLLLWRPLCSATLETQYKHVLRAVFTNHKHVPSPLYGCLFFYISLNGFLIHMCVFFVVVIDVAIEIPAFTSAR